MNITRGKIELKAGNFILLLLLLLPIFVNAQTGLRLGTGVRLGDETQLQVLSTTRFDKIMGYGVGFDGDELIFQPQHATRPIRIKLDNIRSLKLYKADFDDSRFTDPTYLRTALPGSEKGTQFRNLMIINSMVEHDINPNFRVGGGVFLPVGFSFSQRLRVGLGKNIHLGLSNQSVWAVLASTENALVGDLSAILTLGNNKVFVSGAYHLLYDTSFPDKERAVSLAVGGQLSPSWYLYSELFFVEQLGSGSGFVPGISGAYRTNNWRFRMGLFAGFLDVFTDSPLPFIGADYYW